MEKCDKVRKVDFNPQREVSIKLRSVGPFLPSAKEKLKKEQPELHTLLVKYKIIQKPYLISRAAIKGCDVHNLQISIQEHRDSPR